MFYIYILIHLTIFLHRVALKYGVLNPNILNFHKKKKKESYKTNLEIIH